MTRIIKNAERALNRAPSGTQMLKIEPTIRFYDFV
jgi:hypothetical protein